MRHSGAFFENGPQGLCPPSALCHNITVALCQFYIFLHCPRDQSIEYFESQSLTVSINGVTASLICFNTSLAFSIFSLCVKRNTFFISISLTLCHSFIQGWFVTQPSFGNILFPAPVKEKNNKTDCK